MVLVVACTILFLLVDRTIGQDTFTCARGLRVVTWNVAAINNNPFEYWITHEDAAYNKLMADVESFIDAPGARDVKARVSRRALRALWPHGVTAETLCTYPSSRSPRTVKI